MLSLKQQGNNDRRSDLKRCTAFWNVAATQTSSAYIILICVAKVATAHGSTGKSCLNFGFMWQFGIVWICLGHFGSMFWDLYDMSRSTRRSSDSQDVDEPFQGPRRQPAPGASEAICPINWGEGEAIWELDATTMQCERIFIWHQKGKNGRDICHSSLDFMVLQYYGIGLISV